jgi:hypothetical protein
MKATRAVADAVRATTERLQQLVPWALWFVALWGAVAVGLIVSLFFLPFRTWSWIAGVAFGSMEGIGLRGSHDPLPPLTQLIRRYVPRYLAFPAIYGLVGAAGAYWFRLPRPQWIGALFAVLGWLSDHFTTTYSNPPP